MKIHCIGIGGIGVSALAQYYLEKGHHVLGSDLSSSELTDYLQKKGIGIIIGQKPENISEDLDLVIYSPAVKPDNPEFKKAKELGIEILSYPEALGQLTRDYETIAISGSHGKSTTTAMTALVLIAAGLDPTVIVGTKLKEFGGTNYRVGKSKYLVIEACEYDASFENYFPNITVVTNVDKEHLDYFKNFAGVIREFKKFILKLPTTGFLVANKDDKNLVKISKGKFSTKYYSLKDKDVARLKKIMKVPGQHNVSNALAVVQVARILGIKDVITFKALSKFTGTWRRFETKEGKANGKRITVVSDYGHHPSEVLATLKAAREKWPKKKIGLIYQPHQYQRTYYLFDDFVKLFRQIAIDWILITDIYDVAGREEKFINQKINSQILVKKIGKKHVRHMSLAEAEAYAKENMQSGEVLIIMGAGNVYKLFDNF
jgi:UDP-N-acetylmuramate--alanine ligase